LTIADKADQCKATIIGVSHLDNFSSIAISDKYSHKVVVKYELLMIVVLKD